TKEKTRGSMTREEAKVLSNALSNVQMAYVEVSRESGRARTEPARGGEGVPETAAQDEVPEGEPPPVTAEQGATPKPEPSGPVASTEPETESRKKFTKSYGP